MSDNDTPKKRGRGRPRKYVITKTEIAKQEYPSLNTKKDKQVQNIIDLAVDNRILSDIPTELSNSLTLLARKLSAYLTYFSAASLTRLNTLNNFISAAEDRLYNVNVEKLDMKELNSRYREAKKSLAEIMTVARQVSQQACEADNNARVDEIYNLLSGMSANTLAQLQEALTLANEDDEDDPQT